MVKTRGPKEVAPDLLERIIARFGDFPLTRNWLLSIDHLGEGQATVGLEPNEVVCNGPSGVVNGGVLATLADMTCAFALSTGFDGRMPFATSDLHIRYLDPAASHITAEATVIRASLRSAVLECRLSCQGRVVALCTAHFTIKLRARETP